MNEIKWNWLPYYAPKNKEEYYCAATDYGMDCTNFFSPDAGHKPDVRDIKGGN